MRLLVTLASTVAAMSFAPTAQAAYVSSSNFLTYSGEPGERNDLTLTIEGGHYIVSDSGADITIGFNCDPIDRHRVSCLRDPGDPTHDPRIALGDGDDVFHGSDDRETADGGDGNDELHGGAGGDRLAGGAGNDLLDGGGGDTTHRYDSFEGMASLGVFNDLLDGGPGADVLQGGGGDFDGVDYSSRTDPVTVTFNGLADDGAKGEGDLVAGDVEDATGGAGDDTLLGSSGPNGLRGMAGDDAIDGGGGYQDVADGGDGNDLLRLLDGGVEGLKGIDGPIPGFKFDDMARCDSWDRYPAPGDDTAFVDMTDAGQAGQLSAADIPCEHVFMAAAPQMVPVQNGTATLPVGCGAGPVTRACSGNAIVRLPKRGRSSATPKLGRRVAQHRFRTKLGRRAKARAKLSRAGRRAAHRHRLRAWVVYRYR